MNNFKIISCSLLAIISFSLVPVSAQAGGISIRIGGFGYGSYYGHDSHRYRPSTHSHYRKPVVSHRHYYEPYYGYRYNSHYRSYDWPYYQDRHDRRHHKPRYRHNSKHYQKYDRHNSHGSRHNRFKLSSSKSKRHRR